MDRGPHRGPITSSPSWCSPCWPERWAPARSVSSRLAAAFAELVRIVPTAGFTTALQRAKSVSPEMADTVLWASLAVASLGAATLALLAGPISHRRELAVAPLLVGLASRCRSPPPAYPHRS